MPAPSADPSKHAHASASSPPALRMVFDNSFARELPGAYVAWQAATAAAPRLLFFNAALATELGLDVSGLDEATLAALWVGNQVPAGAEPIAQVYAGHQFGGFSPQLGDGRALLLGEVIDTRGRRRDIAFKGSGRTPYSRGGDGKAAVGPMLREVLMGECLHALGLPTTRALAVVATGEPVYREQVLPGAVLTRVAASHLRVGSFQYFAARGDVAMLRRLLDHAVARHDPALIGAPDRAFGLLRAVAQRQARLVAQWMNIGFIHGVMNTDNMALSGETIDFGPCAFLEAYDPQAVFSSIDRQGRYAYANQPHIARWNLARLAEALLPAVVERDDEAALQEAIARATEVIDAFPAWFEQAWREGQRAKLGLGAAGDTNPDAHDAALADDWLALLQAGGIDFTLAWRHLGDAAGGNEAPLRHLVGAANANAGCPAPNAAPNAPARLTPQLDAWLARWRARCASADARRGISAEAAAVQRRAAMHAVSPAVIARNHRVEEALAAATTQGDLGPFERLLAALRRPFDTDPAQAPYMQPAPPEITAAYRTFCGT